jgi:hypothetical protein
LDPANCYLSTFRQISLAYRRLCLVFPVKQIPLHTKASQVRIKHRSRAHQTHSRGTVPQIRSVTFKPLRLRQAPENNKKPKRWIIFGQAPDTAILDSDSTSGHRRRIERLAIERRPTSKVVGCTAGPLIGPAKFVHHPHSQISIVQSSRW